MLLCDDGMPILSQSQEHQLKPCCNAELGRLLYEADAADLCKYQWPTQQK